VSGDVRRNSQLADVCRFPNPYQVHGGISGRGPEDTMAGRCAAIMRCRTVAVLAAIATVAGCGSSQAKTSTTTSKTTASTASSGIDPAFRAKAAAICDTAGQALRAEGAFPFPTFDPTQPDPTKFPAIAAYENKTVANIRTWQAALHALGQPTAGSGVWTTLLGFVDRSATSTIAQQRAAQLRESAAFTQTYRDLSGQAPAGRRAAAAAGLATCDPNNLGNTSKAPPVPAGSVATTAANVRRFLACLRNHGLPVPANGVGSANNSVPPPLPAAIRTNPKFVAALALCRPLLRIGAVTATTGHG
jgi:hypothetical protein